MPTRLFLIGGLALLAIVASPVLGTSVATAVAAFIVVVGIASSMIGQRWRVWLTTSLGLLGGLAAAGSAIFALLRHGGDVYYNGRVAFGGAALLLGLAASVGALLIRTRPKAAAAFLLGGSLLGFVAINLFEISTPYFVALPLCAAAAALAWGGPPQRPQHEAGASDVKVPQSESHARTSVDPDDRWPALALAVVVLLVPCAVPIAALMSLITQFLFFFSSEQFRMGSIVGAGPFVALASALVVGVITAWRTGQSRPVFTGMLKSTGAAWAVIVTTEELLTIAFRALR